MEVALRPATPADDDFMDLVYASTREDEMAMVPWTEEEKEAFVRQQSHAQRTDYVRNVPDAEWLVVERDGDGVGRVIVHRGAKEIGLMDVALLTAHRGAGVGRELMRRLVAESDESGKPIRLHVETFNRVLGWYERLGFERVGSPNGVYFEMVRPAGSPARKAG